MQTIVKDGRMQVKNEFCFKSSIFQWKTAFLSQLLPIFKQWAYSKRLLTLPVLLKITLLLIQNGECFARMCTRYMEVV